MSERGKVGRPPVENPLINYSTRLRSDQVEQLNTIRARRLLAGSMEISISLLIREAVDCFLKQEAEKEPIRDEKFIERAQRATGIAIDPSTIEKQTKVTE